ncbi:hypothetical protein ACR6C2_20190 [Streptomyces sp. INA 01156]
MPGSLKPSYSYASWLLIAWKWNRPKAVPFSPWRRSLMARVWIEDRNGHAAYAQAVAAARKAGRTPPGRYRVRWYGPDGKPKMKTVARKVDAEAERTRLESRLTDGSYRDPAAGRVKFAEVADSWLAAQIHLKRSTRNRYRGFSMSM